MEIDNKYKILLADDEPQNIKYLFETLNSDVYRIFIASNGKVAVELTIKHQPDAIIMDWDMPEMNGMEAIKIIRLTESVKKIPIIVATGRMITVDNLRTALECGANDFIRKPFEPIEIEARVNSMIRLSIENKKLIELEKQFYEKELERINKEYEINIQALNSLKLRLISNAQFNDLLIADLQNMSQFAEDKIVGEINKIVSKIKTASNTINWKEFEVHFEKVHPNFYKIIRNTFPELTDKDLELCTYFKLNMTTNEILTLTNKSKETLKKSKQRLKKKLALDENSSLYNFVNEIDKLK